MANNGRNLSTRLRRFSGLIDQSRTKEVTVVGIGGVGSATVKQLAQLGVRYIEFYDFDTVDEINRGTQGYMKSHVGKLKTEAMLNICREYGGEECQYVPQGKAFDWEHDTVFTPIAILATDDIDVRKNIYLHCLGNIELLIDGRMAAESGQIFLVHMNDETQRKKYEESFFERSEALQEDCTSRATIYCGEFIASLIVGLYKAYCIDAIIPFKVVFNLRTLTIETEY